MAEQTSPEAQRNPSGLRDYTAPAQDANVESRYVDRTMITATLLIDFDDLHYNLSVPRSVSLLRVLNAFGL